MAKTQEASPRQDLAADLPRLLATKQVSLSLPDRPRETIAVVETEDETGTHAWREVTIRSGDTFARILRSQRVDYSVIHALANAGKAGERLSRIRPGDQLRLGFNPSTEALQRVVYQPSIRQRVVFEREGKAARFSGRIVEAQLEQRLQHAHGEITTSLFQAAAQADLPDRVIMQLVDIFRWDIDFVYNIRRGDRFTLVYETFYRDGEHVSTGNIVAAEFVNQGRVHRAVRYSSPNGQAGYFAPDGTSMRKAFLRTPVEFTRISSRYGSRRHPISNRIRNHHGVDYAAPRGTPIQSTGKGRIAFRGRNGGYGNMIVIEHAGRYSTAYAHMSRFASGQRVGSSVSQGEIIGYVGSTGFSTGPHLHYEFRVNNRHRNPLTLEFPSVEPVADENMEHFRRQAGPRIAQLATLHRAYAARD